VNAATGLTDALSRRASLVLDPPVLQPAGLYLELTGEGLRKRAFMIDDPNGAPLCVRPDMTVPACRAALDLPEWKTAFAVRYEGLVFRRRQALKAGAEQFVQAGAEWFAPVGAMDAQEPHILATALESCRAAGVEPVLKLGDVGAFAALARSVGLSTHWSERLVRAFSRAGGPQAVLEDAARAPRKPSALATALAGMTPESATAAVAEVLATANTPPIGGRGVEEIAARLRERGARASEPAPETSALDIIRQALTIDAAPDAAFAQLARVVSGAALGEAVERLHARWVEFSKLARAPSSRFALSLGRGISYYDGFVFELEAPSLGARANLGGGGRYDGLIRALAAAEDKQAGARDWAAAGFALRPSRLADAAA
jgi:ATP phosphoribosyltransferase regulatory subunit